MAMHLYISPALPANVTALLFRRLLALTDAVPTSYFHPIPNHADDGDAASGAGAGAGAGAGGSSTDGRHAQRWRLAAHADPLLQCVEAADDVPSGVKELLAAPSTPSVVLWDDSKASAVATTAAGVIRALQALVPSDGATPQQRALLAPLADDAAAATVLDEVVPALYEGGTTDDQAVYEAAYRRVFHALDQVTAPLASRRFLGGQALNSGDVALLSVLFLFQPVFYPLFKMNKRRLQDDSVVMGYVRDAYTEPGVADVADVAVRHAKAHHWGVHGDRITGRTFVPLGGQPDLLLPHARYHLRPAADGDTAASDAGGVASQAGAATEDVSAAPRTAGEFVRPKSKLRQIVTADGSSGYKAEAGRYVLVIAKNCPWCHRVALMRSLKGLEDVVDMDVVYYRRHNERGWQYKPDEPGCTGNTVKPGVRFVREYYEAQDSTEGSVPILIDRTTGLILNNESSEIIRMLDLAFHHLGTGDRVFYPVALRPQVDDINQWVYTQVNNGAYRAGFSRSQQAYEAAFHKYFAALDRLDTILSTRRFLCGDDMTEADVRAFPTIFRHDPVYFTRFRLNKRMVRDYKHLQRWLAEVSAMPAVAAASDIRHCKNGYFGRTGTALVPVGPEE